MGATQTIFWFHPCRFAAAEHYTGEEIVGGSEETPLDMRRRCEVGSFAGLCYNSVSQRLAGTDEAVSGGTTS